MKPVEGTILTVAKDAANAAMTKAEETDDCIEVMKYTIEKAEQSLNNTPNLLAVLKEVGVVDSGGKVYCVSTKAFKRTKRRKS